MKLCTRLMGVISSDFQRLSFIKLWLSREIFNNNVDRHPTAVIQSQLRTGTVQSIRHV